MTIMNWTFGIITDGKQDHLLKESIESIQREVPHAQLIIVGGEDKWQGMMDDYMFIDFHDKSGNGWITRKKNLVAQNAKYDNLCIMHDYVVLGEGWYKAVKDFGEDWLTCMHCVLNADGKRYRDWCMISNDARMEPPIDKQQPPLEFPGRLLDYNNNMWGRWQYLSGTYFCAKRKIMLTVPLDEKRYQNGGEDVQWSRLLYQEYGQKAFIMNPNTQVWLLKLKEPVPWQLLPPLPKITKRIIFRGLIRVMKNRLQLIVGYIKHTYGGNSDY